MALFNCLFFVYLFFCFLFVSMFYVSVVPLFLFVWKCHSLSERIKVFRYKELQSINVLHAPGIDSTNSDTVLIQI